MTTREQAAKLGAELNEEILYYAGRCLATHKMQSKVDALVSLVSDSGEPAPLAWCATLNGRVVNTYYSEPEATAATAKMSGGKLAVVALAQPADTSGAQEAVKSSLLREGWDLVRTARNALLKMGLRDRGSDCGLLHEVRMFSHDFSSEGRDGPGALQVRGNGKAEAWMKAVNAALAAASQKEGG